MRRWKFSALASAACLCAALYAPNAAALSLGAIHVQSHLGEPLRAEIDIPELSAAEAASLQTTLATPDIFQAHGMEFGAIARSVRIELVHRAQGASKIKLSTTTPVNDPFIDLILQANWNAGNLTRSYTLLLDPPPAAAAPAPTVAAQASPPAQTGRSYRSQPRVQATIPATAAPAATTSASGDVTVRPGDTAGRIATAHAIAGVSLDQMLVAMLHSNPSAFIGGNINRIKAGAVLNMPDAEQAHSTSAKEARQIVAAQSRDFNAYRRKLAERTAKAQVGAAERSASGKVQAQVQDSGTATAPADKLTLSKGAVAAKAEEQLAQEKQAAAQDARAQELQRNLAELEKISNDTAQEATVAAGSVAASPETTTAPSTAPEEPVATLAVPANLPTPAADADAATEQPAPEPAPKDEVKKPAPKKPAPPPPPAPEPSFIDDLLGNPLVPAGAAGIVALLGLLVWRKRKQQQASPTNFADTSLDVGQLPPDSLFDSSGGQQVDTKSEGAPSTMAYSPSQLDASGDVDPIAEADVYLAYGKEDEALKILREALRTAPDRVPLHVKLAEIYAKQQDLTQLEITARTVHNLTQGTGADWERVRALGFSMDPYNTLYTDDQPAPAAAPAATSGFAQALAESAAPQAPATPIDDTTGQFIAALDSQLDIAAPPSHQDLPSQIQDTQFAEGPPSTQDAVPAFDFNALDLDLPTAAVVTDTAPTETAAPEAATPSAEALDFTLDSSFALPESPAPAPASAPAAAADDFGLSTLDFSDADQPAAPDDFGLSQLDLGDTATPAAASDLGLDSIQFNDLPADPADGAANDPLTTKLDLAQEFAMIGDAEGARALIEEVLAEADGTLKVRAQKMLSELD
ncbi:Uncharacterised protein [uncultured Comamonas sp.]|nr:Uncharacterised protein [uncultured Comamonas sp.]